MPPEFVDANAPTSMQNNAANRLTIACQERAGDFPIHPPASEVLTKLALLSRTDRQLAAREPGLIVVSVCVFQDSVVNIIAHAQSDVNPHAKIFLGVCLKIIVLVLLLILLLTTP